MHVTRREMYDAGLTDPQIGELVGVSRWAIGQWRRANGLAPHRPAPKNAGRLVAHDDAQRRELYDQGMSDAAMAKALGRDARAIRDWRNVRNLPPNFAKNDNGRRKPGVLHMTAEMKEICLRLVKRGLGPSIIAKGLGVSYGVVEKYRCAAFARLPRLLNLF